MFNFMKKGSNAHAEKDDKEKRKSEKKEKKDMKKKERRSMTAEELLRLDEVRRSLRLRGRRKEKEKLPSGITADYSADFLAEFREKDDVDNLVEDLSGVNAFDNYLSSNCPPLPPKRGILKPVKKMSVTPSIEESISISVSSASMDNSVGLKSGSYSSRGNSYYANMDGSQAVPSGFLLDPSGLTLRCHDSAESLDESTNSFVTPPFSLSPVECHGLDSDYPLPAISNILALESREILISKQPPPRNDFGFSLRKISVLCRDSVVCGKLKSIILVEPTTPLNDSGLLPGDELLEVNSTPVENKSKDEVVALIVSSGNSVTVKVRPVPEVSEVCFSYVKCVTKNKPPINYNCVLSSFSSLNSHDSFGENTPEIDRFWLLHRGGFSEIGLSESLDCPNGKIAVTVYPSGEIIFVDEESVEKANPKSLDRVPNLIHLRYLNESSILHTLRQRYCGNLIHSYAGNVLLIINPFTSMPIYSDKIMALFKSFSSDEMPPHVYSVAQTTYKSMFSLRRDHSIIFQGRSGSGKTSNFKHVIEYLAYLPNSESLILPPVKLNAIWVLLDAFCTAKTVLNNNSSRCSQLFHLDYDQCGQLCSASIQISLLDKWRLVRRKEGEETFKILHYLLYGPEGSLRRDLSLDYIKSGNIIIETNASIDERNKAAIEFERVCSAFAALNVSPKEMEAVWFVLAAIIHLGYAGANKNTLCNRWYFRDASSAQKASYVLGINLDDLVNLLFGMGSPSNSNSPGCSPLNGMDMLHGFIIGLYQEIINVLNSLINRSIYMNVHSTNSILVIDAPGWQAPSSCGSHVSATLTDFIFNYICEKMQDLFYHDTVIAPLQRYSQEDINVSSDIEYEIFNENKVLKTLENIGPAISSSSVDLNIDKKPGILWIIEELANQSSAEDPSLIERIFSTFSDSDFDQIVSRGPDNMKMILKHCHGSTPVMYSTEGWLKLAQENPMMRLACTFLQDSIRKDISDLFSAHRSSVLSGTSTIDGRLSLSRASSVRRSAKCPSVKSRSLIVQTKMSVEKLLDVIRRTKSTFIHCYLPLPPCEIIECTLNSSRCMMNVPFMRNQIRGTQILAAVRLYKQGFPDALPLAEFNRKFAFLIKTNYDESIDSKLHTADQDKSITIDILTNFDIDASAYRIGVNQIFLRAGLLHQLQCLRDEKMTGTTISLQAYCRGYLSRKQFARKKVQTSAIKCIQKNVRQFLGVRNWSWWKLVMQIKPLLIVSLNDDKLKAVLEDLEVMKLKYDKLEQERNLLKNEGHFLEVKMNELATDLAEEHSSSSILSERMNAERESRIKLEKELLAVKSEKSKLEEATERLELELLCSQTSFHEDVDSDEGESETVSRERFDNLRKELDYTKRRLNQQHQYDMDQLMCLKKQLEKKLADSHEELDEQKQLVNQWKRKFSKLTTEINDTKLHLEETSSRNIFLEKKQKKFDSESQLLLDELQKEKSLKEKLSREKDGVISEKCRLEDLVSSLKSDVDLKDNEISSLKNDLNEMNSTITDADIASLKKMKLQLESKCSDLEEELDDYVAQVQMLENAKLKLEMSVEQIRKDNKKEVLTREEEIEDIRCSAQKKIKVLESELEVQLSERTSLLREKNELERRLAESSEHMLFSQTNSNSQIVKLKKELKKTKTLLRDARVTIQSKVQQNNKAQVRQLRNQIEDAEHEKLTALKSKQNIEMELLELTETLTDLNKQKHDLEEKLTVTVKEKDNFMTRLEETEEELYEVLKKFKNATTSMTLFQTTIQELTESISSLELERSSLKESVIELQCKLQTMEKINESSSALHAKKSLLRIKELESKIELDQASRTRLEAQINKFKDLVEKMSAESDELRLKDKLGQENVRKLFKQIHDIKHEQEKTLLRESELLLKQKEAKNKMDSLEIEKSSLKADLKLALQRIDELQFALQAELEDASYSDSIPSSDTESDTDPTIGKLSLPESRSSLERDVVSKNTS